MLVARSPRPVWAEHAIDRGLDVPDPVEPREQPQVLGHAQLAVERRLLRHPAGRGRLSYRAGVRRLNPGQDREQRRLAGAVRPDAGDQLAARASSVTPRSASRLP